MRLLYDAQRSSQGAVGALQGIKSPISCFALQPRQLWQHAGFALCEWREAQATEAMRRAEVEEAARAE